MATLYRSEPSPSCLNCGQANCTKSVCKTDSVHSRPSVKSPTNRLFIQPSNMRPRASSPDERDDYDE